MKWALLPLSGVENGRCACGMSTCAAPGKHPLYELAPNGSKSATKDRALFEGWRAQYPRMNVGVATGLVSELVALDVDGETGAASLSALEAKHGALPTTYTVRTGRGRHLYFHHAGEPVPNSQGRIGPGLDVRGEGGYVVGQSSWHISGSRYVADDPHAATAGLPDWLRLLMLPQPPAVAPAAPTLTARDPAAIDRSILRARAYLATMPDAVSGQGGHDTIWRAALHLRGFDLTADEVIGLLWTEYNPRCQPPWSEREVRHKVADAFAKARTPAGFHLDGDAPVVLAPASPPKVEPITSARTGFFAASEYYARRVANRPPVSVPCGLPMLDEKIGGLRPGRTYVISAETKSGKSAMATQWMSSVLSNGVPAMMLSMEMSYEEVIGRIISQRLRIPREGRLTEEAGNAMRAIISEYDAMGDAMMIDDRGKLTIAEMAGRTRSWLAKPDLSRWRKNNVPGVLFVDYMQLAGSTRKNSTKEQEVSEVSEGLHALAKEVGIPIVAVVQLNRAGTVRHSGQIEQDADVLLRIQPANTDVDTSSALVVKTPQRGPQIVDHDKPVRHMEILIERNRHGSAGTVNVDFEGEFTLFSEKRPAVACEEWKRGNTW